MEGAPAGLCNQTLDLTQQMLAYSGRGRFVIQPLRLDTLVQEMTKLLQGVVSKKAAVTLELAPATVEGDATQIRQIVMNLITNASEALEGNRGVIRIATGVRQTEAADLRSPFCPEELPPGLYAFVEVEDNGCGMSEATLTRLDDLIHRPHGIVLVTGPTGSGKTTTLYAALSRLDARTLNIMTVEDPIEYDLDGIGQTQANARIDLSFARALRAILRQDPDVIMIGEIRDLETAQIAVQASLTGHLVLATLHTNDAASSVTRLIDMGLQPYQVAATVKLCVAQRLVRRLCQHCRQPRDLTATEANLIGRPGAAGTKIYKPKGCPLCNDRGYRGRIGVFELLPIDADLGRRIVEGCDEGQISQMAREKKVPSLRDDAAEKLLAGLTSYEELVTVSAW